MSAASGSSRTACGDGLLAAERAQELDERPERDPVAVREAAAGEDGRLVADLGARAPT